MAMKTYGITLDGKEYNVGVNKTGENTYDTTLNGVTYPITVRDVTVYNISDHLTGIDVTTVEKTGEQITPNVLTDGTVVKDTDYTVTYGENIVGTGFVYVNGIGTYTGSKTYTFTITSSDIADHVSGIYPISAEYTGEAIEPSLLTDGTVVKDTDYTVTYSDNVEVGTGKVLVTGTREYTGTDEFSFEITEPTPVNILSDDSTDVDEDNIAVLSDDEPTNIDENDTEVLSDDEEPTAVDITEEEVSDNAEEPVNE